MRLVKEFGLEISAQEFGDDCSFKGVLRLKVKKEFIEKVLLLQALGNKIVLE